MKNISTIVIAFIVGLGVGYAMWATNPQEMPHTMNMDMESMMNDMTASLQDKTGDAFDKEFLTQMIIHHQGAVDMAKEVLQKSKRPELLRMANDIISVQTKEINQMADWKATWFKDAR